MLVGAFNQEKALEGAFSVIVKTDGSFAALLPGVLAPDGGLAQLGFRAQPVQGGLETVPPPACSAECLDTCHNTRDTWELSKCSEA